MLQQLWNKLANTGLTKNINEREFIKIRLLNQLGLLSIITATLLFIVTFIVTQDFGIASLNLISLIFSAFLLILNHYHFYNLSRHFTSFLFPLWVAIAIINLKNNSIGEPVLFLIISLISFILYEGQLKFKIACLVWNIGLLIGTSFFINLYAPIILNIFGMLVLMISLIISISIIITFYQNDIQKIVQQKNKLVKQLQLKNTELERFAYITSHDLKEPIKNIEGFSSLLQKSIGKEGNREHSQMANMIYDSSKRMSTLIDSILKFSRLEKAALQFESVDLNDIIQSFKQSHSHFLANKKAVIQHNHLPIIQGNKVYLSLLFQNLLENAIKYNESAIPSVKIFAHQEKNNVRLVIDDNGIGIKENYEEYIFEPFRRLHNRQKYEGTGLGLAICKKIVENHAGEIWAESSGNGSQFNIVLPVNEKKAFHLN